MSETANQKYGCLECGLGLHAECSDCVLSAYTDVVVCDCIPLDYVKLDEEKKEPGKIGRPPKADDDLLDPHSTLHKRAVEVLRKEGRVYDNAPCEWQGLKNCGGGKHPIIGCVDGVAKHVHHGPNKDWKENVPTNLHNICHKCHNRWHAWNDPCYSGDGPFIPHSPTTASEEEVSGNDALWEARSPSLRRDHSNCG